MTPVHEEEEVDLQCESESKSSSDRKSSNDDKSIRDSISNRDNKSVYAEPVSDSARNQPEKLAITAPMHHPKTTKTPGTSTLVPLIKVIISYGTANNTPTIASNYMKSFNARVPTSQQLANILTRHTRMQSYDAKRKTREIQRQAGDILASSTADTFLRNDSGLKQYIRAQEVVDRMCGRFVTEYNSQFLDWNRAVKVDENNDDSDVHGNGYKNALEETVKRVESVKPRQSRVDSTRTKPKTKSAHTTDKDLVQREPLAQIQKETLGPIETPERNENKKRAEVDDLHDTTPPSKSDATQTSPVVKQSEHFEPQVRFKPSATSQVAEQTESQPSHTQQSHQPETVKDNTEPIIVKPREILSKHTLFLEQLVPAGSLPTTTPYINYEKRHFPPSVDHLQLQIQEMYEAFMSGVTLAHTSNGKENAVSNENIGTVNGRGAIKARSKARKEPQSVLKLAASKEVPVSNYTMSNEAIAKQMQKSKRRS